MTEETVWIFALLAAYFAYCLYWASLSSRTSASALDFLLAGKETPAPVFVLAGTGICLTGWIAMGHPSMVFEAGLPFAHTAIAVIAMALGGILFLKRQWILGTRFGYVTQGDLLSGYYSGEAIRIVTVVIALVFAVPFVGLQLGAQGRLIEALTAGALDRHVATWSLGFLVFLYACLGGFRAVTFVGALQTLLVMTGMVALGLFAYAGVGGFAALNAAMARLAAMPEAGAAGLFQIPGVIAFTRGLYGAPPPGGVWTTAMILTYSMALAGFATSPAMTMLSLSCRSTRGFAPQQVWTVGGVVGIILLFFTVGQGMGALFLGASGEAARAGVSVAQSLPEQPVGAYADITAPYLQSIAAVDPWFAALLAVCAIAGLHLAAAMFVSVAATAVTVDVYKRFVQPAAGGEELKLAARIALTGLFLAALFLTTFAPGVTVATGAIAPSFGAQLFPALAGVCWYAWITRQGATLGLIAGLIVVLFTEPVGNDIAGLLGFELPWGRWPWTIHSAGWGLFCNVLVCAFVSLATRGGEERAHRSGFHAVLTEHAGLSSEKRRVMKPAVWALALAWAFFAFGPGAIVGNDLFGAPEAGPDGWVLGMPSLWAWQGLWWALGMVVIWWLAYKMEMSTSPRKTVDMDLADRAGSLGQAPLWIRNFLRRVT